MGVGSGPQHPIIGAVERNQPPRHLSVLKKYLKSTLIQGFNAFCILSNGPNILFDLVSKMQMSFFRLCGSEIILTSFHYLLNMGNNN